MVQLRIIDLENYAKENNVPIMQKDGIEFLIDYIKKNKIKSVLEIGSAIGYSAIRIALETTVDKVVTIERDKERYDLAVENINKFDLFSKIEIIYADALDLELSGEFDLIFIDAAKSQYIKFFEKYEQNLAKGGVIVSDNLSFHGMVEDSSTIKNRNTRQLVGKIKRYIDFLNNNTKFDTKFYKIGDGISISKKNDI